MTSALYAKQNNQEEIFSEKKQTLYFTCICKDSEDFSHRRRRIKIKIGTDIQRGALG